ncbi:beta-N-acetylhexosaminidase [Halothiobacillus sp. DCM-1]|uniref:beta-N-acetylhexosaminidase n=1 Tax=Halothiobacillus sp. DCM-1 TaxID=3112558 RepID=UPI003252B9FF
MSTPLEPLGPLMVDVAGYALTEAERRRLRHPAVGGVILFARNFTSRAQLMDLTAEIRALRHPHLLIAVDQEGGRVQRFRSDGFVHLPPMGKLGALLAQDRQAGIEAAHSLGWLMATQLRMAGVDLSFAPVLDLHRGISGVIGDRAFAREPAAIIALAVAFSAGMKEAGMSAVGKHFPGHGSIAEDSHIAHPVDTRPFATIEREDLRPFLGMIERLIPALMAAHVIYPAVDDQPAGFSRHWLKTLLRERWQYQGAVFSDDLTMAAASVAGDIVARVDAALTAGCDMALICNHPEWVDHVLAARTFAPDPVREARLARLTGHGAVPSESHFLHDPRRVRALAWVERLQDPRSEADAGWFLNEQ